MGACEAFGQRCRGSSLARPTIRLWLTPQAKLWRSHSGADDEFPVGLLIAIMTLIVFLIVIVVFLSVPPFGLPDYRWPRVEVWGTEAGDPGAQALRHFSSLSIYNMT